MKILIFGAGGVGSVVGGFLARTGHDVSLLGRAWHLDAIEKQGLVITGIWGDYRIKALELYRDVADVRKKDPSFDLIILTVKSYDTEKAAKELLPLMLEKTMLLALQNGLGNIETILQAGVRSENFLAGRVIFGVDLSPGVAKVTVNADSVRIGELPRHQSVGGQAGVVETKASAFQIARAFAAAKIPAEPVPDILTYIWAKVIYNCALNAICSLREMPYGKVLENAETRAQMERVVRECYAVGLAKRVALDPSNVEAFMDLLVQKLIPSTAAHFPSMFQDLKRGKRTDIDALNGAISRYAKELGIPAPENEELARQIHEIEANSVK